ncbi:hypothetical protein [Lysobacter humi (ex Lee et al. 2017)]
MSQRLLVACVVALAVMSLCMGLGLLGGAFRGWMTPLGLIAPGDLLGAAFGGIAGGWIARRGFRMLAIGLVLAAGLAGVLGAWVSSDLSAQASTLWLMRNALAPLVLASIVAWLAAAAGERLAQRRTAVAST